MKSFPKIELHLHLDCSLSFEVASKIDSLITREKYARDFIAPSKCKNLSELIKYAQSGIELMQTAEALRLVTIDLIQQLGREHVIYAEIRFAPLLHTQKGLSPEQVVENVSKAAVEANEMHGVETRLILCTLRHFTRQQSLETVELVEKLSGSLCGSFTYFNILHQANCSNRDLQNINKCHSERSRSAGERRI